MPDIEVFKVWCMVYGMHDIEVDQVTGDDDASLHFPVG